MQLGGHFLASIGAASAQGARAKAARSRET